VKPNNDISWVVKSVDRKFKDVESMRKSSRPLVMYGYGSYAKDVSRFLKQHGINVDLYCVDDSYIDGVSTPDDAPNVVGLSSVDTQISAYDIVIGFADYRRARKSISGKLTPKKVYFIDAPNQYGFMNYDYVIENAQLFNETLGMLGDDLSKDIFKAFVNAKLSGDPEGLYDFAQPDQYFDKVMDMGDQEFFVDCGAFDGDTLRSFISKTHNKFCGYVAFEPDLKNYDMLKRATSELDDNRIEIHNVGCWSKESVLKFSSEDNTATITAQGGLGGETIKVDSIDNILAGRSATVIKMDIEGAELESLRGAKNTIISNSPKLAICAYHKKEDLITLPQYIRSLNPKYSFYLRHHQFMSWELVLYAVEG